MGDRGNVYLRQYLGKEEAPGIFLYTHWGGFELPETVRKALVAGRGRWGDDSYLARIVFSQMIGDDWESETGYGLSTYLTDNEWPIIIVDSRKEMVELHAKPSSPTVDWQPTVATKEREMTFPEYIALTPDAVITWAWGREMEDE